LFRNFGFYRLAALMELCELGNGKMVLYLLP